MLIYKICEEPMWEKALRTGVFKGAEIDFADGYIHFSTADQVKQTAAKHFAGREGLLLIAVDAATLGDALKWEPSRGGALFPHLYRSLLTDEALWAKPLKLGDSGQHLFDGLI